MGDGDANDGITIQSGSTHQGNLAFNHSDGTTAHGRILYQHNTNYMAFFTNNTEEMRLLSGGGLTFNGDTAAANALDDYEEGTWTPTIAADAGPTAYNYATGYFTKVGRMVQITGQLRLSTVGSFSGATVNLGGFPFTISNSSNYDPRGVVGLKGAGTAKSEVFCRGVSNTLYARIEQGNGGTSDDRNMNANAVDTGTTVFIDLVYFVD